MTGVAIVETNLLLLLIVGSASPSYIAKHDRLRRDYTIDDFCSISLGGIEPTLITVDRGLANAAYAQGYGVVDYKRDFRGE